MSSIRVLLLLSQSPLDSASGAARSMRTICEFLAGSGFEVHAISSTASENNPSGALALGYGSGLPSTSGAGPAAAGQVVQFATNGVHYCQLQTGSASPDDWEDQYGGRFNQLYEEKLRAFRPDILFTYGGSSAERARQLRARQAGAKIVFGLRNLSYLVQGAFDHTDAVLTGSRFVSERYRGAIGMESTPLPLPLSAEDVIAPARERVFVTYVNPSIEKGAFFAARLFEELARRRPDIPVLVVESRASAGLLVAAGLTAAAGLAPFDLRRHGNIMVAPAVPKPAEIFALARVVVMPSVWEEPAGRVAAEALLNGIPPVVSDRGGLPEIAGGGGFVRPIPPEAVARPREPVGPGAVEPWVELLLRLTDDEGFYEASAARAAGAGRAFHPDNLIPRYAEFFRSVAARPSTFR